MPIQSKHAFVFLWGLSRLISPTQSNCKVEEARLRKALLSSLHSDQGMSLYAE
jgi:hypothetical protein